MKYVQINAYATAWAKSIVFGKHKELIEQGHESYVFWGRPGGDNMQDENCQRFASNMEIYADVIQTRLDGHAGFHSKKATERLLKKLDEIDPDVVHLHILCGYYINVEMLFEWLAKSRCQVLWTLHDCWAFTGHCTYFTIVKCMQWQSHCTYCPQPEAYPYTFRKGQEEWNFAQKKRLFTLLPADRMKLITPSQWLADLTRESFLAKYPVEVRHNTIDTNVFKPTPSDFRERYGLEDKFIVLGVASTWSERKGLDDFIRLANELDDRFVVVLVGLTKKQIKQMPKQVLALERTANAKELAEIYTAADVHVQPSREETYGMTVAEAQACGTPVIVAKGSACEEIGKAGLTESFDTFAELKQTILSDLGSGSDAS